jgi:hypothetical protein
VWEDGRRARIRAAVTGQDATAGAGAGPVAVPVRAVDEMVLSGCAVVLMSEGESAGAVR